mmetsp:Transcript_21496/g.43067  ORF Transcript_21496/g.43067 Transcript_21496/m.43067 type:complete len:391 (-) Transcript_21496:60-1232(-)
MILLPLHHQLVRPADQLQAVHPAELVRHGAPEHVARPPRGDLPGVRDVLRVAPHEVAEGALVRDLLLAVDGAHLVEGADVGGEAAVDAEDAAVDDRREVEAVEDFHAVFPGVGVAEFAEAFVVEAVDCSYLTTLVVSPEQRNLGRIPRLQTQQQRQRLDRVVPPVHEIPHENIARLRHLAPRPEQLQEVPELPVDVPHDRDGGPDGTHVALLHQQRLDEEAQFFQGGLRQGVPRRRPGRRGHRRRGRAAGVLRYVRGDAVRCRPVRAVLPVAARRLPRHGIGRGFVVRERGPSAGPQGGDDVVDVRRREQGRARHGGRGGGARTRGGRRRSGPARCSDPSGDRKRGTVRPQQCSRARAVRCFCLAAVWFFFVERGSRCECSGNATVYCSC